MADRIFFVQLNLDEMSAQLDILDSTHERGEWLEGFRAGTRGSQTRETWSEAKMLGHAFGLGCLTEAEEFQRKKSEIQSARGKKSAEARRARTGSAQPTKPTAPEPPFEPDSNHGSNHGSNAVRTGLEPQRTSNIEQPQENIEQLPPTPQGGKRASTPRFVPPTEEEWVAYCTATWPDWHPTCAAEGWAYYESKGWKIGTSPCKDWKAAAKTSHGKAREWGTLQPQPSRFGRPTPVQTRRASDDQYAQINPPHNF